MGLLDVFAVIARVLIARVLIARVLIARVLIARVLIARVLIALFIFTFPPCCHLARGIGANCIGL
jgi:hypothetical protein